MTKPKSINISPPFDPRHVGGVTIPGATLPTGLARASSTLEPDSTPSHTFAAHGTTEVPRRSNTIATSLAHPSLKLKASLSLLRGRSHSSSPERTPIRTPSAPPAPPTDAMPVQSLRKKPSTSKFWQRTHHAAAAPPPPPQGNQLPSSDPPVLPDTHDSAPTSSPPSLPHPQPQSHPELQTHPSTSHPPPLPPRPTSPLPPAVPPKSLPLPPPPPPPTVRPKRADSGTAIDFADVPPPERPLGFREILAVRGFEERMAAYGRAREYWARADHGLGEWVGRVGAGV